MNEALPFEWRRLRYTPLSDLLRGRVSGRLDVHRLIDGAGLPEPICHEIRQVVSKCRLWGIEKVDVANELIAHFHDGLDAGRSAEDLIGSFGNAAQAARLIRRAKKRNRPFSWHMLQWTCWLVAGLSTFYVLAAVYQVSGSPSISTDYLAIVNRKAAAVSQDHRAWPLYREAVEAMSIRNPPQWLRNEKSRHYGRCVKPGDADWPEAHAWLTTHKDAVALVRQAAARPGLGLIARLADDDLPEDRRVLPSRLYDEDNLLADSLVNVRVQSCGFTSTLGGVLAADAIRAAAAGEGETALADLAALLGMSRHAEEAPGGANGLSALWLQTRACVVLHDILANYPNLWSEEQLHELAHHVAAHQLDPVRWLEGDRLMFRDLVQRVYTDDGQGDGHITVDGLRVIRMLAPGWLKRKGFTWWPDETESSLAWGLSLPAANAATRPNRRCCQAGRTRWSSERFLLRRVCASPR